MPAVWGRGREVREGLVEFQVEEIDALTGEVMVSRASEKMLEPIHQRANVA